MFHVPSDNDKELHTSTKKYFRTIMPLSRDDYDKVQVAAWSECVQLYCGAPMNTMIAATSVFALYFSNLPHTLPR